MCIRGRAYADAFGHPLIDCQEGALRDDFDFGAMILFRYTHLRAHETPDHPVCGLLLEKKKKKKKNTYTTTQKNKKKKQKSIKENTKTIKKNRTR